MMKLLFENWRKYLKEEKTGMMTVDDLMDDEKTKIAGDKGLYVWARPSTTGGGAVELVYASVDRFGTPYALGYDSPISGEIEITPYDEGEAQGHGPCHLAWQVKWSTVTNKWGPLLYDMAMEYATMWGHSHCEDGRKCGGLIADREEVSVHARAVWDYYLGRRSDVGNYQLDDMHNTLTPDIDEDNCSQEIASPDYVAATADNWVDSALSKRYTKKPTTIDKLIELERFIDHT
jgi:hypothetical protein